jgi:hypothetical protein
MIRRRRYIRYAEDNEPKQKKSAWHYAFMVVLIVMFAITTVSMQGCAAPKSRQHRAIEQWQQEGHYTYKVEDGIEYFVKCEGGRKYIGVHRPATADVDGYYDVVGPIDVCTGEEE